MASDAWQAFQKENDELLREWCNETDPDRKAKLWNEIIERWADWKGIEHGDQ